MPLPNFVIFGAQKAGTTSIYNYLKQHPQIYMSPVKETNFFLMNWEEEQFRETFEDNRRKKIRTLDDYTQLFADVSNEVAIGEVSPNYLLSHETSALQILKYIPKAKLIAVLRNPVDRAYSDYLMNVREGRAKRSLSEQIKNASQKSHVILKGFYYKGLRTFYDHFDSRQIKIFLYDDLRENPINFMQKMYQFLEVDSSFVPDINKIFQKAQVPKSEAVNKLLYRPNLLRSSIATILRLMLPLETRQKLRKRLIDLNMSNKAPQPLSPEDRQQLLNLYQSDILKLQDLIQRDLSKWLQ